MSSIGEHSVLAILPASLNASSVGSLPVRESDAFLAKIGVGPTDASAILASAIFPSAPRSHRADADTGTTSRRWRGAREI